jgi:hypothetical protein
LKGEKLKKVFVISAIVLLSVLTGCNTAGKDKELLTVEFQQGKVLRYEFVMDRGIHVDWGPLSKGQKPVKERAAEYTDFMQIVMAYKPVEINPYGPSVIEATCEKVTVNRTKQTGRVGTKTDAVTTLEGKTFRFTVGPTGEIVDYTGLNKALHEAGEKSFRTKGSAGLVKEPDMLGDFIAIQWFLWDAIASIKNPAKGVSAGQSWESQVSLPLPMLMKAARDVKYTLTEVRPGDKGNLAVIKSDYSLAKETWRDWLLPYPDGVFQMSGPFGFFRDYKLLELHGQGEELFNIDAGRLEKYNQQYNLKAQAGMPMGLDVTSQIYIKQDIRITLVEDNEQTR